MDLVVAPYALPDDKAASAPLIDVPDEKSVLTASFPERCNYAGSVSPKASMILRWMGLVSV